MFKIIELGEGETNTAKRFPLFYFTTVLQEAGKGIIVHFIKAFEFKNSQVKCGVGMAGYLFDLIKTIQEIIF